MKKAKREREYHTLPEYDFSKGVRGKYAKRYAKGTNIVVLAPDMAKVFRTSESVNEALRTLVRVGPTHRGGQARLHRRRIQERRSKTRKLLA
jgi:hypothetical protein